jgi:hypothetical protein
LRRFLNDPTSFLHFFDYLPFEEDLALYLNKFDFLHPRIICKRFDFGPEDFQTFLVYFYSFAIISPWRGAIPVF